MSAKRQNILNDESGAAYVEFTAAAFTFFIILFGVIEFTNVFYQWNAAAKATQWGARLAAVSAPVASNLTSLKGTEAGALPGAAMPNFDCVCSGVGSGTCTGSVPANAAVCAYSATNMNTLVYGRGNGTNCTGSGANIGMCTLFSRITPQNVVVRYQYTGLGYAGRPPGIGQTGAPVPTITVSITGLTYDFILVGALAGIGSMTLPSFATTVTGEDLNGAGG